MKWTGSRACSGLVVLMMAMQGACGSGLDRLHAFMQDTRSGAAQFTQTNDSARKGGKAAVSSGMFQFSRPGRFRWEYREPYVQLIVGDGQTLWVWDPDLKQVTRKTLANSLGSTPAAILAGDNALEKGFRLEEGGVADGLEWVVATPKVRDSGFDRIRLGFDAQSLSHMELQDSFGHIIHIQFTAFKSSPHFAPDTFHFTPPAGADVIQ